MQKFEPMLQRRLTWVLGMMACIAVGVSLLATASLVITQKQVIRGRVASDIAAGFIQLSAHKQRLRTWVGQALLDTNARREDSLALLQAMRSTLAQLHGLTRQAIELDGSEQAREEHVRRLEALQLLHTSLDSLERSLDNVRPLASGANALLAWQAQSRVFDLSDGRDLRALIRDNISREAAAVQRERQAADATLSAVRWLWLACAAVLVGGAALATVYFRQALRRPLLQLSNGARALHDGQLQHRIELHGNDELTEVARSLNLLATELDMHRQRESQERQQLEALVDSRTRELAQAVQQMQHTEATRRRLLADISHELRTPTTVIRGEAEIALRGQDKTLPEYKQALTHIATTTRQLGAVIEDLLAMARSDAPTLTLAQECIDLQEFLSDVQHQAAPLAKQRQLNWHIPPLPVQGLQLLGDLIRLRQLLGILLNNACRYATVGSTIGITTEVGTDVGHRHVDIVVHNDGLAIAEAELPLLFERHFRGHTARTEHPEGLGLGLGIARHLAVAHGGELNVQHLEGRTRAVLRLPLRQTVVEPT